MFNFNGEIIFALFSIILALIIFFATKKLWPGIIVSLILIAGYGPIAYSLMQLLRLGVDEMMMLISLIQSMGGFGLVLSLQKMNWPKKN